MKTKNYTLALLILIVSIASSACSMGKGNLRDKNLEQATLTRLDSVPGSQYVGMADTHELEGGKLQAVIIYYVTDSVGNRTEYNVRVTTNDDGSKIYSWEEMDSHILSDVKQKVNDKMEEKGIPIDDSMIDALIELRKR